MKNWLDNIRTPDRNIRLSTKITSSLLVLLLGIGLGAFSKWLDNMAIDDTVWWQHILGILDLGNVFSLFAVWFLIALAIAVYSKTPWRAGLNVFLFFAGMCVSYHVYTVVFSGFNPRSYMMIWYGLTLVSPILAFICWYGKGKTTISLIIDIGILGVMMRVCFSIGMWYFDFTSTLNTLFFIASVIILYDTPRNTVISLVGAVVVAFCLRLFL